MAYAFNCRSREAGPQRTGEFLAGENACPPGDVDGAPGYEEFLQALADSAHPEHEDLKEWIGGPLDPVAFDVDEVNQRLNQTQS